MSQQTQDQQLIRSWQQLMRHTWGDQGYIAVLFLLTAKARHRHNQFRSYFPSLMLYGPPSAGKTSMARILMKAFGSDEDCRFTYYQGPEVKRFALEEKLATPIQNLIVVDDYSPTTANIRCDSAIRYCFDGHYTIKTETMTKRNKVVSSMVICCQQLPRDTALTTRSIILQMKPKDGFNPEAFYQLEAFDYSALSEAIGRIANSPGNYIPESLFDVEDLISWMFRKSGGVRGRLIKHYALLLSTAASYQAGNMEIVHSTILENALKQQELITAQIADQ